MDICAMGIYNIWRLDAANIEFGRCSLAVEGEWVS